MSIHIKDAGVWKDTKDVFIKLNGVWQKSSNKFIKIGGNWANVNNMSGTKLNYDMTIASEPDSSRYLVNKTATYGPAIRTNPTRVVSGAGNTVTYANDKWTVHLENSTGKNYKPLMMYRTTFTADKKYDTKIKVVVTTGRCFLDGLEFGGADGTIHTYKVMKVLEVGTHYFTTTGNSQARDGSFRVIFDGTKEYNCDFTVEMEIKEILTGTSENLHKAPLHSGHSVALTGNGVIDVPINATLGANDNSKWTRRISGTGNTFILDKATSTYTGHIESPTAQIYEPLCQLMQTHIDNTVYEIKFTIVVNTGQIKLAKLEIGEPDGTNKNITYNEILTVGTYQYYEHGNTRSNNSMNITFDGKSGDACEFTIEISVRKVESVQGSVAYFDYANNKFKQPTIPLSTTYQLKNGTYGAICKLHTNHFSDADITAMNNNPELLITWYLGTDTLPSGIVKGANDKLYPANERMNYWPSSGEPLVEMNGYERVSDANIAMDEGPVGHVIYNSTTKKFTIKQSVSGGKNWRPKFGLSIPFVQGEILYVRLFTKTTQGKVKINSIVASKKDGTKENLSLRRVLKQNEEFSFFTYSSNLNEHTTNIDGLDSVDAVYPYTLEVEYNVYRITDFLLIEGTFSTNDKRDSGIQNLLLKQDKTSSPIGLAKINTIEGAGDGRYVQLPLVDNTLQKHLVTKCLTRIHGDITQVVDVECIP